MVTGNGADTEAAFKNCAPFIKCTNYINDGHIDDAENIDIAAPIYNLIEYSDNYSHTSGRLWQFKRDEPPVTNDGNPDNVTTSNSTSFKSRSSIVGKTAADGANGTVNGAKVAFD